MKNKDLFKAIGSIDDELIENAGRKKRNNRFDFIKWGLLAASLLLVFGIGTAKIQKNSPISPEVPGQSMAADPMGPRKMFIYNGYRYEFVDNGAEFAFPGGELDKALGILEFNMLDENKREEYAGKEFAATFALGGTLYEIKGWESGFRVAVQLGEQYYLAQIVAKFDEQPITADQYITLSNLKELAESVHILSHMGSENLEEITDNLQIEALINELCRSDYENLSNEQYEEVGRAQSEGKSFQLEFVLKDRSHIRMYLIPELKLVTMGDNIYRLHESFGDDFNHLFESLQQPQLPMS